MDGTHARPGEEIGQFSTDTTGLVSTVPTPEVRLADGERLDLRIGPATQRIGDIAIWRLAYNGSVPGPPCA